MSRHPTSKLHSVTFPFHYEEILRNPLAVIQPAEGFVPPLLLLLASGWRQPGSPLQPATGASLALWPPRGSQVQMVIERTESWAVSLGVYCPGTEVPKGIPLAALGCSHDPDTSLCLS